MKIVTTTSVFPMGSDQLHVLDRLAQLGYTTLDMAFDYCDTAGSPFLSPHYEDWAKRIKDRADQLGVQYSHSHASFDAADRGDILRRCNQNWSAVSILLISAGASTPVTPIGYTGDLVLEAHHQSMEAPDEKRDIILTELMSRAKQMVSYYNQFCEMLSKI